jgi:hypothetical protein
VETGAGDEEEEREKRTIEILEFTCSYGCISHERNTLEKVYEEKKAKCEELARELKTRREEELRVTAVIASSMGALDEPSMKELQKVLRCNNKELGRLARQISETVVVGRQNARRIEPGSREEVNEVAEEEVERMNEWQVEHGRGSGHGHGRSSVHRNGHGNGNRNGGNESESQNGIGIGIRIGNHRENDADSANDSASDSDMEEDQDQGPNPEAEEGCRS